MGTGRILVRPSVFYSVRGRLSTRDSNNVGESDSSLGAIVRLSTAYWIFGFVTGVAGMAAGIVLEVYEAAIPCGVSGLYCAVRLFDLGELVGIRWSASEPVIRQVRQRWFRR